MNELPDLCAEVLFKSSRERKHGDPIGDVSFSIGSMQSVKIFSGTIASPDGSYEIELQPIFGGRCSSGKLS